MQTKTSFGNKKNENYFLSVGTLSFPNTSKNLPLRQIVYHIFQYTNLQYKRRMPRINYFSYIFTFYVNFFLPDRALGLQWDKIFICLLFTHSITTLKVTPFTISKLFFDTRKIPYTRVILAEHMLIFFLHLFSAAFHKCTLSIPIWKYFYFYITLSVLHSTFNQLA